MCCTCAVDVLYKRLYCANSQLYESMCCRGGVRMMCCRCAVHTNSPFVTHFQSCVVWIYRYTRIDKLYPKSRTQSKCHKVYPIMCCLDTNRCIAPHQISKSHLVNLATNSTQMSRTHMCVLVRSHV